MSLTSLNSTSPSAPAFEELNTASAPELEELEGVIDSEEGQTAQDTKKFEWNVERLFAHNPEHSETRTWFVRILSLIVGLPTLILDLGRRLAFSLGAVNGKSYSLIDVTSQACQSISEKVKAFMAPKELTLEDQNQLSKEKIEAHAEKLVNGYRKLNGGLFHTNSSLSSPHALNGFAQIRDSKLALIADINEYMSRNAHSTEDLVSQVEIAKSMVEDAIHAAAGEDFFIQNKVEYRGEPDMLRDVAYDEFLEAFEKSNVAARQFINVATQGTDTEFVQALSKGIKSKILTKQEAIEALQTQSESRYVQGLETGIDEAYHSVDVLLNIAEEKKLVTSEQADLIFGKIHPEVELLASATARDIVRKNVSEETVRPKLVLISKHLERQNKLKSEEVSQFLTSAESYISQARAEVELEKSKAEEEASRIEAERVAAVQKAVDQQTLLGKFEGMLDLIQKKQEALTTQFLNLDQLEEQRRTLAEQLDAIEKEKVIIRGKETTVLQAANAYLEALRQIMKSNLTPAKREEQMTALANEGFTRATMDKISVLKALDPQVQQLIHDQGKLVREISKQHDDIVRLRGVYKVFKKHNFSTLEEANRKLISSREVLIKKTQETLSNRHAQVLKTGIFARMKESLPSVPVNIDPQGNREEVDALIEAERVKEEIQEQQIPSGSSPWYQKLNPLHWIRG